MVLNRNNNNKNTSEVAVYFGFFLPVKNSKFCYYSRSTDFGTPTLHYLKPLLNENLPLFLLLFITFLNYSFIIQYLGTARTLHAHSHNEASLYLCLPLVHQQPRHLLPAPLLLKGWSACTEVSLNQGWHLLQLLCFWEMSSASTTQMSLLQLNVKEKTHCQ